MSDIKKVKVVYNRCFIDESGGDFKMFWKIMKKILFGEKRVIFFNISVNGFVMFDEWCIVNVFNKFFVSVVICLMSVLNFFGVFNL